MCTETASGEHLGPSTTQIKTLTSADSLHARLEKDCLLDLEYPALVLFNDFQSLVDNYRRETISLVRRSSHGMTDQGRANSPREVKDLPSSGDPYPAASDAP